MKKILIVEDVELNIDLLVQLLEIDYALVIAGDGASAVEKAASERPDLILMDMALPVMDGWEATRRIKADRKLSHIPIVALTAHAMQGDEERALGCGCSDYLSKPIDEDLLFEKIGELLPNLAAMVPTEAGEAKSIEPPTVLVVDDEPFNVDLLTQELEDLGLRTIAAANGREALTLIDERGCDMMLLDIMMPEMDGIELLERLNATGRLASLPVIVVYAVDDIDSVARCIELGAEDHLLKPFDPILLRARIGGALEKKALRDQVARQLAITRTVFGKYVPESIAESILAGEGTLTPVKTVATILYCDIEGFTSIVEHMSPVRTMEMLNEYFAAVLEPIRRHGGIVNQFLGDAMLVMFNVPVEDPRHGDKAVRSAIDIQSMLAERRFAGLSLRTRIGINTGPVVAGNVGAEDRLHYTVYGDAVNVASRLEALNKVHGTNTLISGSTVEMLREDFFLERLGDVQIRGKDAQVTLYRLPANEFSG